MIDYVFKGAPHSVAATALLALALAVSGCGGNRDVIPANTPQPDRFLMDRANEALKNRKWLDAREYFRQIVDNYPQSPLRPDAKLGIGDTYLGEGGTESFILAANEFREFLTFYPTHARADYAQYGLAMSHFRQMRAPERDQTETQEALKEFDVFFQRFPNSPLIPEVRQKWREARDRLSEAWYRVGLHYFRIRWYPGAVDRFREILKVDPEFTHRDAVYYYLAESLFRGGGQNGAAEALPYYDRIVKEFSESDHLEDAAKRIKELSAK